MNGFEIMALILLGLILWALCLIEGHLNRLGKRRDWSRPTNPNGSDMVLEALDGIANELRTLNARNWKRDEEGG